MFIEPKITYSEFMTDNPTFWNDRLQSGDIDEATVNSIFKWFKNRIVCDDFNFETFFDRQLDLVLPRYNKLVRLENTEFDALVSVYRERQVTDTGSESGKESNTLEKENETTKSISRSTTRTPNLTDRTVRTPDLTVADTGETSSTSENSTTSHNEGQTSNTSSNDTSSVSKQNPQSISYASAVAGQVPALDWSYPSSQQQSKGTTTGSGTSESDATGSSDAKQNGTSENTQRTTGTDTSTLTRTGTETTAETGSDTASGTGSETGSKETELSKSNLRREIFTGRDNLTPQDALREAMSYVKQSSAFAWLKDQLQVCFYGIYDI